MFVSANTCLKVAQKILSNFLKKIVSVANVISARNKLAFVLL